MKALVGTVNENGDKAAIAVFEDSDLTESFISDVDNHEGHELIDAPDECESGWKFEDGALVAPPDTRYMRKRARAYPSIQDQMDMQYHDEVDGTTTWKETIKAVKDAHPKP